MELRRLRRLRYGAFSPACRCSQRRTRRSSQTVTLNRIHGERSRCGRKTVPGASIMPSRCEFSASASESSICGKRAQARDPRARRTGFCCQGAEIRGGGWGDRFGARARR